MNGLSNAGLYVIQTLGGLYLLIVLLRFILQLVRADFYNPLSQAVVKATKPLLNPLRRIIPGIGGIDVASLALAYVIQLLVMALCMLLLGADLLTYALPLLAWRPSACSGCFSRCSGSR